jgi:hypothetical protein
MNRIAIVKDETEPAEVVAWINGETPMTWKPPAGTHLVREEDMTPGWIEPPEPTPPVPESVSPEQFRKWLLTHGISLASVEALIDATPDELQRDLIRVEWEYSLSIRRAHPLVSSFGHGLGLDGDAIDKAFIEASEIS